jgi:HK97 family phage major capsid protein
MKNSFDLLAATIAAELAHARQPRSRRIITRGVIDMATSAVLESEGYDYAGPMALADAEDIAEIERKLEGALKKHFEKVNEAIQQTKKDIDESSDKRIQDGTKAAIEKLNKDGQGVFAEWLEFKRANEQRMLEAEQKLAGLLKSGRGTGARGTKTIGEQLVESEQFKSWVELGKKSVKSAMSPVEFKTINPIMGSDAGSAGPGAFPEYLPSPVIPNFMPLTIRDLIGQGTTENASIHWVKELLFTNNAGYQGSDGSLKPQSDITYQQETINVVTIGHWFRASKQILADFKMLQTLINNRAAFGVKFAEEQSILYGDGASGHLYGIIPQATAYDTTLNKAGDTMIDVIRHAMLQTTKAFYPATGIAVSPTDWHDISLTKDKFGRYMFADPTRTAPAMLWGLPVAECFSMEIGDFLVGSLKLAVTLFDREQATILLSTEDQDNFVRNLVTILAEERLALAVSRPAAVVYGSFPAGSTDTNA